ncbi:MAG: endonuclease/exonuclease/phosphatase family metal-dependent hydrolase [Spirosomataceae bacterium]|jgi:endonuclease/exonuclease/phosphatase family metal-dependent hydrolase
MIRLLPIALLMLSLNGIAQEAMNVMTFNIRYSTSSDGINQWDNRKDFVAQTVIFHEADICGMQEALYSQIKDLEKRLPEYGWVGVGRDDGDKKGEFSPVFYRKKRFDLLETNTFWLNEHPEKLGYGWDARFNRVVTWAKLRDKITDKEVIIFNTHFDHEGEIARRESAKLVLRKVKEIAKGTPFLVTGDFNAQPSQEPIQVLTDESKAFHFVSSEKLSKTPHFGPRGTFTGFKEKERNDEPIDYIFVAGKDIEVSKHATLSNTWGGLFASDHFAVMTTLRFD